MDTQETGCQRWAREHDWLLDERFTYRDRHSGEELWERPELTKLREAARARSFGVLVCHSIDRLSRDPIHLGILLDELARQGIGVQFVTEELDDSPEAALIRFIKGYAGKVENERRRERIIRAMRASRAWATGRNRSRPLRLFMGGRAQDEAYPELTDSASDRAHLPQLRRRYDAAAACGDAHS